jgi:hypothetical protein
MAIVYMANAHNETSFSNSVPHSYQHRLYGILWDNKAGVSHCIGSLSMPKIFDQLQFVQL